MQATNTRILCFGTHSAAICGLSLLLVLSLAPRGFSSVTPVFPGPQNRRMYLFVLFLIFCYNTWSEGNHKVDCPFKFVHFLIFWQIILLTRMTNEHLRCITNIEYLSDITNIPQQKMLVFVGNNLSTDNWIKNVFQVEMLVQLHI